jgi:hypothetical protein
VNIRICQEPQVVIPSYIDHRGIVFLIVTELDAMYPFFFEPFTMYIIYPDHPVRLLTAPSGMVPEDIRILPQCFGNDIADIGQPKAFGILEKYRIEMTGRHRARYLRPLNEQEAVAGCQILYELIRPSRIDVYIIGKRSILVMIRYGEHIESVPPCLTHPIGRPDKSVGKNGVSMEVAF